MTDNAEHLEAMLSQNYLSTDDIVNLLTGHRVRLSKSYGDSTVHNLVTGNKVVGSKAKDIIERWKSLNKIWESSTHGRSDLAPTIDTSMYPRDYALQWAWKKHKPTSTIWKGFSACLKHGLEQEWITPHDYVPQEETPEEVRETKAKLDQVLGQPIKGKASEYADKDGIPYKESENTVKNRLRLIGLMAEMLQNKNS